MAKRNHVFEQLGVKLKNDQNSWGGRDANGKVFLTFWTDLFRDGRYVFPNPPPAANGRPRAGLKEFVANLKHAVEHYDGRVGVVMSLAENPRSIPRKVARSWVAADMRIIRYDETGAFEAELA
jgi:hypothetical protein